MITKNEVSTLSLSPTKKDFAQIWNELLDVAAKLSERWDPTSTNESDPGIVLLKALSGIADKLNYNIDKNTLEAFMPTAAQEESMRKLCEMMGYNMKYLRSATTSVTFTYSNPEPTEEESRILDSGLPIPKFTVVKTADGDISYFTTNQNAVLLSTITPEVTLDCMEGQIVKCESLNDNNAITINQLTTDYRFYLPEIQIAENGIFIYNIAKNPFNNNLEDGKAWTKVDNLNTQKRLSRVFKFGYDSYEGRPYIEFPDDASELFEDGIFIYYARTSGENGSVSARTLTQLELPSLDVWQDVSVDSFIIENTFASVSGSGIESISQAYNNFKKTIGTFDTLVTCRDYMNKIYSMVNPDNRAMVSNVLVTDIRNDLNRAITICSCSDAGIYYKEKPITYKATKDLYKPVFYDNAWHIGSEAGPKISKADLLKLDSSDPAYNSFKIALDGRVEAGDGNWVIVQNQKRYETKLSTLETEEKSIDHFDLVLYPFKTYNQIKNNVRDIGSVYDSSFQYSERNLSSIKARLEENRTIAHEIVKPRINDILSINNYLRLNAFIATTSKITSDEGALIIDKIKIALANAFNMRQLDFGEEIPFESILEVIEKADSRIKSVSLADPTLYTTYSTLAGYNNGNPKIVEYATASDWLVDEDAIKMDRLVDTEVKVSENSAVFYAEKVEIADTTGGAKDTRYALYTFIGPKKLFLNTRVIDTGREDGTEDFDAFMSLEQDPKNKTLWFYNDSYKAWACEVLNKNNETKTYFLGAYDDSTLITLSDIAYLADTNYSREYPAQFISIDKVKPVSEKTLWSATSFQEKLATSFETGKGYRLAFQPYKYGSGTDSEIKNTYYAQPFLSENYKHLLTTQIPESNNIIDKSEYLFNTEEAKKIYNKLAVRNVLAGRLPLFNYYKIFATDFSEAPYQITEKLDSKPANLTAPDADNIFTIYVDTSTSSQPITYAGQYIDADTTIYTKTYSPEEPIIKGEGSNVITDIKAECEILGADGVIEDVELQGGEVIKFRAPNFITKTTYPAYVNYHLALNKEIHAEAVPAEGYSIATILNTDLNNYNANKANNSDKSAQINWEKAFDHFSKLQATKGTNELLSNTQKDYNYIQTQTLSLKFDSYDINSGNSGLSGINYCSCGIPHSAFTEDANTGELKHTTTYTNSETGDVYEPCGGSYYYNVVDSGNDKNYSESLKVESVSPVSTDVNSTFEDILQKHGCIRFDISKHEYNNNGIKAIIKAQDETNQSELTSFIAKFSPTISIDNNNAIFINNISTVWDLQTRVEEWFAALKDKVYITEGEPVSVLPTVPWQIDFVFQYIPVETETLWAWQDFFNEMLKLDDKGLKCQTKTSNVIREVVCENNNIFWRRYTGYSYDDGKYVQNGGKYLPFTKNSFSTIDHSYESRLANIYILVNVGRDAINNTISNGSEYQLLDSEYLYINYTPSNTDAEGNTKTAKPKNIVYGPGTIIRPSGFESGGLIDSSLKESQGTSWVKQVDFEIVTQNQPTEYRNIYLHSLGANEQIEIRDFAETVLSQATLNDNTFMYVYKNFDEPILEGLEYEYNSALDSTVRVNNYTLKEGEYIFYTDLNKKDAGYFTNGTLVTLNGGITIPRSSTKIDIGTILESGLDAIDWELINLSGNKWIKFTEFQYITLGEGDTLKTLTLLENATDGTTSLNADWQACTGDIHYIASTTPDVVQSIPAIVVQNPQSETVRGNGWEACSLLELNVTPKNAQTLRKTDKVSTKLGYTHKMTIGTSLDPSALEPATTNTSEDTEFTALPVSFKTNLVCQTGSNKADFSELKTSATADHGGFILKVFSKTEPLIVQTRPGLPVPYKETIDASNICDMANWDGEILLNKDYNDIWARLSLENLNGNADYDKALKLSAVILPDTYGLASIYLNYTSTITGETQTWIELPPGYAEDDLTIINASTRWNLQETTASNRVWHSGHVNKLFLYPGVNCLKIKKSCNLIIKTTKSSQGELFYDTLRLVKTQKCTSSKGDIYSEGLNLSQIGYYATGTLDDTIPELIQREQQLLSEIKATDIDHEFYYNVPIERSVSLEFNENNTSQDTLLNPHINYDINNVNNPFVISKLDIDYLDTGLQIARSSRLD